MIKIASKKYKNIRNKSVIKPANRFTVSNGDNLLTERYFLGYMDSFMETSRRDKTEMKAELRVEMKMIKDELKGEIGEVRTELRELKDIVFNLTQEVRATNIELRNVTEEMRTNNQEIRARTEAFERYIEGNEDDKRRTENRIRELESKVPLA